MTNIFDGAHTYFDCLICGKTLSPGVVKLQSHGNDYLQFSCGASFEISTHYSNNRVNIVFDIDSKYVSFTKDFVNKIYSIYILDFSFYTRYSKVFNFDDKNKDIYLDLLKYDKSWKDRVQSLQNNLEKY